VIKGYTNKMDIGYVGTSLSSVRELLLMSTGLLETERTGGGRGEEEGGGGDEDAASTGGEAATDKTGGEDATSTGGEEEEEEEEETQRTGGWGSGPDVAPLTCGPPGPSPFSVGVPTRGGPPPRLSRAFSMLSRSALRSENQQSTSVWDSLVLRDSWSAGGKDQRSHDFYCIRGHMTDCHFTRIVFPPGTNKDL